MNLQNQSNIYNYEKKSDNVLNNEVVSTKLFVVNF